MSTWRCFFFYILKYQTLLGLPRRIGQMMKEDKFIIFGTIQIEILGTTDDLQHNIRYAVCFLSTKGTDNPRTQTHRTLFKMRLRATVRLATRFMQSKSKQHGPVVPTQEQGAKTNARMKHLSKDQSELMQLLWPPDEGGKTRPVLLKI